MEKTNTKPSLLKRINSTDKRMKDYMCNHHRKGTLMAASVGMAIGAGLTAAALMNRK